MSIGVDNTAHAYPGLFVWLCLVGTFLASGEWIDSFDKAQEHPILLAMLAVCIVASSALVARGPSDLHWVPAFLLSLVATLFSSSLIVLALFWVAGLHGLPFTLFGRHVELGLALVVGLPLLFLTYAVVSLPLGYGFYIADKLRVRRKRAPYDRAIAELRDAVRVQPEAALAHLELARALMRKRRLDANTLPDAPEGFMDARYRLKLKEDLDAVVGEFREAVRLAPDDADAHGELGDALRMTPSRDEAIMELRRAIELKPGNRVARVSLALALEEKEDWNGAIAEYREAIRLEPSMPKAHLKLAKVLERLGDRRAALEEFRKAYELEPANGQIRYEYERLQKVCGSG